MAFFLFNNKLQRLLYYYESFVDKFRKYLPNVTSDITRDVVRFTILQNKCSQVHLEIRFHQLLEDIQGVRKQIDELWQWILFALRMEEDHVSMRS